MQFNLFYIPGFQLLKTGTLFYYCAEHVTKNLNPNISLTLLANQTILSDAWKLT